MSTDELCSRVNNNVSTVLDWSYKIRCCIYLENPAKFESGNLNQFELVRIIIKITGKKTFEKFHNLTLLTMALQIV